MAGTCRAAQASMAAYSICASGPLLAAVLVLVRWRGVAVAIFVAREMQVAAVAVAVAVATAVVMAGVIASVVFCSGSCPRGTR